jgi:hypothetical protein
MTYGLGVVVWRELTKEVLVVMEVGTATVVEAVINGRTVVCNDFQKSQNHCTLINTNTL